MSDLVGLNVLDIDSGEKIGIVSEFYDNGAQAVLIIKGEKILELPFVDAFFREIDIQNREIKIRVPEVLSERD